VSSDDKNYPVEFINLGVHNIAIKRWTCRFPVHHVVGKYKTIQCSVICAMITIALKNVTRTLIRFSGKNISWLRVKDLRKDHSCPLKLCYAILL
jgi:hypothetical protein